MTQSNFALTFVSTFLITLYVFGSIITVEAGLKCYACTSKKDTECEKPGDKLVIDCDDKKFSPGAVCMKMKTKGNFKRDCIANDTAGSEMKCKESKKDDDSVTTCFCNTDKCNGGNDFDGDKKAGAVRLSQLSLWTFFVIPAVVTWMGSGGAVFPNGHHHL